ncbi:MAG: NUDIX domain-containing protein [Aigarchaeota archaeon]|nr:NUDIX domain-containing protein [Aigarchaeota archaeon]
MKSDENRARARTGPLGVAVKGIVRREGKYLLLRRSSDSSLDAGLWDLPGGKLDYGEELAKALMREVKEETNLTIKVGRPFETWHFFKGKVFVTGITFLCEYEGGDVTLSPEHLDFAWIEPADYVEYSLSTALEPQLSRLHQVLRSRSSDVDL